jgi:hypothetical protein
MNYKSKLLVTEETFIHVIGSEQHKDHIRRKLTTQIVEELMRSPYMKFTQKKDPLTGMITVIARYNDEQQN